MESLCSSCYNIQKDGKVFSHKLTHFLIYVCLVSAFFLSQGLDHTTQSVIKCCPAIFLSYLVLSNQFWVNSDGEKVSLTSRDFRNKIAIGLFFCAIGDFLLHMEDHPVHGNDLWFLLGLVSFLIGHIFFMFSLGKRSYALK